MACTVAAQGAVTISSKPTVNMSCSGGVCSPTAADAVLNAGDLETLLASGDTEVTTKGPNGEQATDIVVNAASSWSSSSLLSLVARRSITVDQPISVAGMGALSLTTNAGGRNGVLLFGKQGRASFANLTSSLSINGTAYTLVGTLAAIGSAVAANPAGSYAFASDYDASQDGTYSNSPVATNVTGTVEGLGNTISNFSMQPQRKGGTSDGIFNLVDSSGRIDGMRLTDISIRDERDRIRGGGGGLVGVNEGTLSDDHVAGTIVARHSYVGGLVEANAGTIIHSSANMRVRGAYAAGLVLGSGNGGSISLSHADGAVQGDHWAAGLVANLDKGTISESYATGKVSGGTNSLAGGLVGWVQGTSAVSDSYATGAVTGGWHAHVGGFVGLIENSISTIKNAYSTGAVTGGEGSLVGGFAGDGGLSFTDCYWDRTTSGTNKGVAGMNVAGVTGLTTQRFQSGLPAGFESAICRETANVLDGLPWLIANRPGRK